MSAFKATDNVSRRYLRLGVRHSGQLDGSGAVTHGIDVWICSGHLLIDGDAALCAFDDGFFQIQIIDVSRSTGTMHDEIRFKSISISRRHRERATGLFNGGDVRITVDVDAFRGRCFRQQFHHFRVKWHQWTRSGL